MFLFILIHEVSLKLESKLRYNVNIDILIMLYYSLIYPFLIYGVQVWGLTYIPNLLKALYYFAKANS